MINGLLYDKMQEKYPWLDSCCERKSMSDREILDKYVDLDKSCMTDEKKKKQDMEDKRVTYFRHLNMRIAQINLAYPLLKDMVLVLGSS